MLRAGAPLVAIGVECGTQLVERELRVEMTVRIQDQPTAIPMPELQSDQLRADPTRE